MASEWGRDPGNLGQVLQAIVCKLILQDLDDEKYSRAAKIYKNTLNSWLNFSSDKNSKRRVYIGDIYNWFCLLCSGAKTMLNMNIK